MEWDISVMNHYEENISTAGFENDSYSITLKAILVRRPSLSC